MRRRRKVPGAMTLGQCQLAWVRVRVRVRVRVCLPLTLTVHQGAARGGLQVPRVRVHGECREGEWAGMRSEIAKLGVSLTLSLLRTFDTGGPVLQWNRTYVARGFVIYLTSTVYLGVVNNTYVRVSHPA